MRDALRASGRPIVFSLCEWGSNKPWLWARDVGNLWRTTGDIADCWECKKGHLSFAQILDLQVGLETYVGPGHWNDPDMLEVGNGGMTTTEYRSHFSLWCILAAPLMAGNDLKTCPRRSRKSLPIRKSSPSIRIPSACRVAASARTATPKSGPKQMKDGGRAVVLFNRGASDAEITASWEDLGYPAHLSAAVRDLWAKKDLGKSTATFTAKVPSHGVAMLRINP